MSDALAELVSLLSLEQLEASQNAPKAAQTKEGNEADKRCDTSLGIESVEH